MGKGNRARVQRAQDKLDNPQIVAEEKKMPKWVNSAIVIFIAAILALSLTLTALYNSGATLRASAAVKSDSYTVSGTMLSYFFNSQYSSFMTTYGAYASYFGLDTTKSLKSQECSMLEEGGTWYDYFMNSATSYVKELLTCCEYAKANGIELDDEDMADIDEAIEAMNEAAFENNYSLSGYITAMYGSGVKEKDLRAAMELVLLANKAAVDANDKYTAALTEDEIKAYFDEHPENFLAADYMFTSYDATMATVDKDDYENDIEYESAVEAAKKTYEEAKAEALAKAKAYEKLDGFQAFLDKFSAELTEKYDGYYDDDETLTDEEREAKELNMINTDKQAANVEDYAYQDPTAEDSDELAKWLFADGRAAGDIIVIEDEDEDAGEYTAYAYCVTATADYETYLAADVAYALYNASEAASTTAAAALKDKLVADGVLTKEAFEAVMEEQEASYSGVMEDLLKGSFGYDDVDQYIFAPGRNAGDCEVVNCGTDYIAVILYMGAGDEAWHVTAKNGVLNEKMTAWYEELAKTYTVNINEKALTKISA